MEVRDGLLDGKPTPNAYIKSFNDKFRDECLGKHWFKTLVHARAVIAAWRQDYDKPRPHNAELPVASRVCGETSGNGECSCRLPGTG